MRIGLRRISAFLVEKKTGFVDALRLPDSGRALRDDVGARAAFVVIDLDCRSPSARGIFLRDEVHHRYLLVETEPLRKIFRSAKIFF